MAARDITLDIIHSLTEIAPSDWDACANWVAADQFPENPFLTHRFLLALESSGSVGQGTGWMPHYLIARLKGQVVGVAPLYLKLHSQGEYIFDHSWAHAYERAGGQYYPKLQIAPPFTPVTGRRFLAHPDFRDTIPAVMAKAAIQITANNGLSSLHATFCARDEYDSLPDVGMLQRETQQFHWVNQGYDSFDRFLSALSARKRKNIRKERQTAQGFGGTIRQLRGDDIKPHHWDQFWLFYQDTGARKWGQPYLTREFFDLVHDTMRDDVMLVLAERDEQAIAGALNFVGRDAIYGRYWGCVEHHSCLHFELCYYQAIDFAIANGLQRVEAGAQGEHKLARGYLPATTYSLHWIHDPKFAQAVADYLQAEKSANAEEMEILTSYAPFKSINVEEQE
jgi:predicted N-acyltransferase